MNAIDPTAQVLVDIMDERHRQDRKWGQQNHEMGDWLLILTEELGEASEEALATKFGGEDRSAALYTELIQAAAVLAAMAECAKRNGWGIPRRGGA